jgi:hypothetical protein
VFVFAITVASDASDLRQDALMSSTLVPCIARQHQSVALQQAQKSCNKRGPQLCTSTASRRAVRVVTANGVVPVAERQGYGTVMLFITSTRHARQRFVKVLPIQLIS